MLSERERKDNMNVIAIKGLAFDENKETINATVLKFFRDRLNVEVLIGSNNIRTKGKVIVIKLNSAEDKETIMRNKSKLAGTKIFIEHFRSYEGRKKQEEIAAWVKEKREKGLAFKIEKDKLLVRLEVEERKNKEEENLRLAAENREINKRVEINEAIKGLAHYENKETVNATVLTFFRDGLNVEVLIGSNNIRTKGKVIVIKLNSAEDKETIMRNKSKLAGTKSFIEHFRSDEDRKMQEEIAAWVKEKRERVYKNAWNKWEEKDKLLERLEEWNQEERIEDKVDRDNVRKFIFWNVAGVFNKDRNFWSYIEQGDFISLTETWIEEKYIEKFEKKLSNEFEWSLIPAKKDHRRG
ncbi:hypothetical protein TSAR_003604 [Trichomalopsis sarcophagae]|uniref:RRM domain-containing protein n=1 Tax=Trichomalopsis sarcophagae TaxID=543379 RepID=A0A232EVW8_9HYME|nr:hypothetical protein TSAR_003604 [Trichomalopsis sarcophagae]